MPSREGFNQMGSGERSAFGKASPLPFCAFGENLRRLKQHRDNLNRILRDERISGNRKLLGQFLACYLDAEGEEQQFIRQMMEAVWVSATRTRWVDEDEAPVKEGQSNLEKQTATDLRDIFDLALRGGSVEPVQGTESGSSKVRPGVV